MPEINAGLLTPVPNVQPVNLIQLQSLAQQGLLTQEETDRLRALNQQSLADAPIRAAQRSADLSTIPLKPLEAKQALDLGDLKIQAQQESLANLRDPLRPIQRQALADTALEFYKTNPGALNGALPTTPAGTPDLGAMRAQTLATNNAIKEKQNALAEAKALEQQKNQAHLQLFGNLPTKPDGTVDAVARDANLQSHGGTAAEVPQASSDVLSAISQSEQNLNDMEALFQGDHSALGAGPVAGRVRGLNPYDETAQALNAKIAGAEVTMAKGVLRETGNVSDAKLARVRAMFPTLNDPPDVREKKMEQLRKSLTDSRSIVLDELKKTGKNVSRFGAPEAPPASATPPATTQGGRVLVTSKAQWDALPSGTLVKDPQGHEGVKP